jgi:DNA polymerase-1
MTAITLPFYDVPDETNYAVTLAAYTHTGVNALRAVQRMPAGLDVAIDIETPSVADCFSIKCVTAAWEQDGKDHMVLLDPLRRADDAEAVRELIGKAKWLILHNCFAGDTEVITRDGVRRFEDMAGETVEVWADNGWRKAQARCYGAAPVRTVRVVPARYRTNIAHEFRATGNHRWPLTDGRLVYTDDLRPGDRITAARVTPDIDHTSDAFKHGLIFADGALCTNQPVAEGVWGYQMRLCGAKAQWVHLFDHVTYPPSANGDPVVTGRLPFNPKGLPENADAAYLANFIEGWQLLDGSDYGNGRVLATARADHAAWLELHAAAAGWFVTGKSVRENGASSFKPGTVIHYVVLSRGDGPKPVEWRVTDISAPSAPVPVYCVEVPRIERFTLAQGVYTGNSSFDTPGLVAAGLMPLSAIEKVMDTVVFARSAWPDQLTPKGLEACAKRVLGLRELENALKLAIKASGLRSKEAWYRDGDIHMPSYRAGAMADTLVTLRLAHPLFEAAVNRQLDHPFVRHGHTSRDSAAALVMREQRVNRVLLRRAARGFEVDLDYLDGYVEKVEVQREQAERTLRDAGLRPGVGLDVVKHLEAAGELPAGWPMTPTGRLKADKNAMELLPEGHPLAAAHLLVAHTTKILGYMEKVAARSRVTGRLHPQFNVLGASATGRMSVSEPELQQFPEEARPIILADRGSTGMHSIDWSSIEPALLGWMAQDWEFITPFEQGADIYEPIMHAAGTTRKKAKVVVLAGMYGQGREKLARSLGTTEEGAVELQRQMRRAMPKASRYMGLIKQIADDHALALTVSGRVLTVPRFNGEVASYKAVNSTFQGSCADLIYETIIAAEEAGVGDAIMIPMHDEIVCDSSAAAEILRIMQTPPPALIARAGGRVPVIRCDSQPLGMHWDAA